MNPLTWATHALARVVVWLVPDDVWDVEVGDE